MVWAADTIACRPLPHKRLSVRAGVSLGMQPLIVATRARYMSWTSVWITLPKTTCSMSSGWTPARLTASRTTAAPSSVGGLSFKPPPKSPMAVRTPLKTTTSGCAMFFLLLCYALYIQRYGSDNVIPFIHPGFIPYWLVMEPTITLLVCVYHPLVQLAHSPIHTQ